MGMSAHPEPRRRLRRPGPATLRGRADPEHHHRSAPAGWRGCGDFVHADPWRVLSIQGEFVWGFGLLAGWPGGGRFRLGADRARHPSTRRPRQRAGLAKAGYR